MRLDRPRFEDALRLGVHTRRACADGRTLEDVAERLADALHRGLVRGEDGEPGTALVHVHVTQRRGEASDPSLALAGCSGFAVGLRSAVTRDQRAIPLDQLPPLLQAALPGSPDADDTRDCLRGLHVHFVTNARDINLVPDQALTADADVRSVVTIAFDLPPDDRAILVLYARADLRIELESPLRLLGLEIWRALLRVCGRRRSDGGSASSPGDDSLAAACRLQSQVSALRDLVRLHNEHVDQCVAAVAQQRAVADARERRLNAVLQALPDPIFSFRSDGSAFALGQAPGATTGCLPDELATLARSVIETGESQRRIVREGEVTSEFRIVRVDQDEAICLARDISELARAEYETAEARNRTEFMASMSHEIRTPLNGVIGLLELLKRTPLAGEQVELIQTAERSAHHLLDLVSNILDLSRVESGATVLESMPLAIRGFIEEALALIAVRAWDKRLGLELDVAEGVPEFVSGDPLRLRQVLVNLVGNAIKFSDSGTIRVKVAVAGSGLLRFVVSDEGVGVPAHARARVFEAFRQAEDSTSRRYGGSGLGLALCKRYVELMGGTMDLESEEGRGSSFSFTARLPAAAAPALLPEVMRPDSVLPLPLRVLVAEDNAVNRLVLSRVLQNLGHAVRTVDDGRAAVEAARIEPFDLILMDLEMPHLDGLGATRQIVAQSEHERAFCGGTGRAS